LKNDPQPALEGIKLLQPLCESWRQIAENGEGAVTHGARDASQDAHHPASKNSPPSTAGGYGSTATENASDDSGRRSTDVPKAGGITISA
ncbi:MAG: hypothetical protein R3229_18165, partial [Alphaproteobacteria bacterium]|nr:hypothetical protein [Alphaproteobacteria bacterium]